MKRLALLAAMALLAVAAPAQAFYREATATLAWMTPNDMSMAAYDAVAVGVEAAAWHRVEGDGWWVGRRGNPSFGLKASVALVPGGIAGHRLALGGMLRAPLWRQWDYQLGLGLSYYTKSQYFTGDAENVFISTLFSCLIDVGVVYHLNSEAVVTASLVHTSNGMLKRPNLGLNYLQVGVGAALDAPPRREGFSLARVPKCTEPFPRHEAGFAVQLGTAVSRDLRLPATKHFLCYDLSGSYQYYLDPAVAVGLTVDLWYNFAADAELVYAKKEYKLPVNVGLLPYVEGFWGAMSIKAGIGPTVGTPMIDIPFYERVGVYYNFASAYAGVALNAHAGKIEFIEFAYGMRLRR